MLSSRSRQRTRIGGQPAAYLSTRPNGRAAATAAPGPQLPNSAPFRQRSGTVPRADAAGCTGPTLSCSVSSRRSRPLLHDPPAAGTTGGSSAVPPGEAALLPASPPSTGQVGRSPSAPTASRSSLLGIRTASGALRADVLPAQPARRDDHEVRLRCGRPARTCRLAVTPSATTSTVNNAGASRRSITVSRHRRVGARSRPTDGPRASSLQGRQHGTCPLGGPRRGPLGAAPASSARACGSSAARVPPRRPRRPSPSEPWRRRRRPAPAATHIVATRGIPPASPPGEELAASRRLSQRPGRRLRAGAPRRCGAPAVPARGPRRSGASGSTPAAAGITTAGGVRVRQRPPRR